VREALGLEEGRIILARSRLLIAASVASGGFETPKERVSNATRERPMSDMNAWNQKVIEEFRETGGTVGGDLAGMPLLLLHHRGARSGLERTNPLAYQRIGDSLAVFASKGGAPTNPDWPPTSSPRQDG